MPIGGAAMASGSSIEGSISVGGTYTVLLMLKKRKQVEFGYYLSKEKAIIARQFIESKIKTMT